MSSFGPGQLDNSRLHAIVEGRVQGVGFRAFVIDYASRLHLTGWVRNTWNGEVEIVAEGPQQDLLTMLDLLRKGPPAAVVTHISQDWQTYTGEFTRFQVRLSA